MDMLTCMYLSHIGQNKVDTLQNKVDMLHESVINKIDTFQNTTEASHHRVVELLQNINCSSDSKTLPHLPYCKIMGEPGIFTKCITSSVDTSHRPNVPLREDYVLTIPIF